MLHKHSCRLERARGLYTILSRSSSSGQLDTVCVNPCGNFSDTSSLKFLKTKGSIGHAFTVCIHTENQNQRSFYPFVLHEISVLIELLLGHLCYRLTDVPPQPNSPNEQKHNKSSDL